MTIALFYLIARQQESISRWKHWKLEIRTRFCDNRGKRRPQTFGSGSMTALQEILASFKKTLSGNQRQRRPSPAELPHSNEARNAWQRLID